MNKEEGRSISSIGLLKGGPADGLSCGSTRGIPAFTQPTRKDVEFRQRKEQQRIGI